MRDHNKLGMVPCLAFFFFSSRRRHTRCSRDWRSDVCSSDLTVHSKGAAVHGKECDAYRTNSDARVLSIDEYKAFKKLKPQAKKDSGIDLGHCGDCRACWSKTVENISYPLH